jgi:hypothetical protein
LGRARWIKVEATIIECFRAWGEPLGKPHPRYEIVADIKAPDGGVERVTSHQKLSGLRYRWRAPDPGEVVAASWDPGQNKLRLDLRRDPRYDEKLIRAIDRRRGVNRPRRPTSRLG